MIDATLPGKLSTPTVEKIVSRNAIDPLPEIGRSSVSGITSGGIPKKCAAGAIAAVNISKAPDALSMLTAVMRPTKEGAIETVDFIPSFAPNKKVSNKGTFLKNPNKIISAIIIGTEKVPSLSNPFSPFLQQFRSDNSNQQRPD